ncbi:hypothetical protein LRP98_05015 [Campylobacter coli]|uniref:hypothetical protein n=1 Tax=Campylobacter coli TaxID=195 RepID=UPI001E375838|nr:hypothetical protein [Campylobacter coli]MCD4858157.1 hypothetical protein [Campylobacter coli]
MADLEQVVNDLNLASQSLQELREKYDGALDLLDNKNTQITGAIDSAKSNALQEIQTISDTATSQISQLKNTSLNLVNEAKNTATTEISNKKEEHKQELETKKNEYINKIVAKANEYDIANINAQVKAKVTKTGDETIAGVKTFSVPPISATNPTANNQVANKAYVDTRVNAKANANAVVTLIGNQTIAGVKTFSSPVVVPNGTANTHAVNLAQLNTKANQATTYTKTEVDTRVNAKANANAVVTLIGNQTIAGVKTFSSPVVVPNGTANTHAVNLAQLNTKANQATTYTKTEVDTRVNAKANANATVNLTDNQTIAGVKTFSAAPVCSANPTEDAQLARKWYVDYGGGIKNLGNQTAPKIDLRQAQHFILTMTARGAIGIANWGGAGKSGTITVNNAQNITAFSAPFKFRVAQSGFSGTETFAYFCIASNNVLITRT